MTAAKTRSLNAAPPRRLERPARSRPGRPGYDLDSLLTVAVEVFNERGYDGTSMEDLSHRLGITKSAIYHHVSGKEDLLRLALAGPWTAGLPLPTRRGRWTRQPSSGWSSWSAGPSGCCRPNSPT